MLHPRLDASATVLAATGLAGTIPPSSGVVIQLGCGDGAALAAFRRRNPTSWLIGIEADPTLAERASRVLDEVYCLAVEPGPLPVLPPADCILVGPGLAERLAYPAELIAELARLLAPRGILVLWLADGVPDGHGLLSRAGLHPLDGGPAGLPGHTAWRASAAPVMKLHVFSSMLPPVGGVSQVRVVEPLAALAAEPGVVTGITNHFDDMPALDGAPGIFILHRPALLGREGLDRLRALMARGWLVVCEFDDHPSQIPVLFRSDVQNFRGVHAIQTSTDVLAAVLGRENREIVVFPNAVSTLPDAVNFAETGRINVLFAALNREEDWAGHVEALNAAAAEAGAALHFHVIADHAFFTALATPHKRFLPLCDYATYLDVLSRCEVSFMPLRDTLFNRCKSDLKFLEAAAHRVVALAAPTVYGDSIRDGENGLIFADPQGLYQRLMSVVADPGAARLLAGRARAEIARHRMLAYQTRARLDWYRTLWSRRADLHRALLKRVPELG